MFHHSIKVPRLYKLAAKCLQRHREEQLSVKDAVYNTKHKNLKAMYKLVLEASKHEDDLNKLFKRSQILEKEPRLDPWLARILVTELVFGKGLTPLDNKPFLTILAYQQVLLSHASDLERNSDFVEAEKVGKPRYVRINTLSLPVEQAIEGFREEDWNLVKHFDKKDYEGFLEKVANLDQFSFMVDIHVPEVLIFPPKTEFFGHQAYKMGTILLQDKASCLPAFILNPPAGSTVLDMCAAPGMKTTQLAAIMQNQGIVYAVEKDSRRFEILNKMVQHTGASCIQTINDDVLNISPEKCPKIEYILVDPSCTGSGIVSRSDFETRQQDSRLQKLAGFQIKILRHALTKFPDAKRVVYSTCSDHPEENEDVVRQVLETNGLFKLVSAKQFVNDAWLNFGSKDFGELGELCLNCKPSVDLTNGFFIAVFERLQEGEKNVFFNERIFYYKMNMEEKRRYKEKRFARRQEEMMVEHEGLSKVEEPEEMYEENEVSYKQRKSENNEEIELQEVEDLSEEVSFTKKPKVIELEEGFNEEVSCKKKKSKKSSTKELEQVESCNEDIPYKKKKSKKSKEVELELEEPQEAEELKHKKKKSKKDKPDPEEPTEQKEKSKGNEMEEDEPRKKKKKKNKSKEREEEE